jgi:hypothetical protein
MFEINSNYCSIFKKYKFNFLHTLSFFLSFVLDLFKMITNSNEYCSYSQPSTYLPIRSRWARAVLYKVENDRCLQNIDRSKWYRLSHSDLLYDEYRQVFHEFNEDKETTEFIKQSQEKSNNIPLQIIHSLLTSLLTLFITRTSGTLKGYFRFRR